jgi:diguanylate cyclase (GGDEF)-like protein/PAS domain S-box-containing protein
MTNGIDPDVEPANEALRLSESRYRRLFETAQDGIMLLNSDTAQIEDVNPYLISMLGYSHAEFLGKKLWEVGPFADVAQSKGMFAELQANGYARYENLPLKTKAGQAIDVEFVSNSYQCEGLKVIQCNVRNISDRTSAEAQARLRTQLYAALSACNQAIVHCSSEAQLLPRVCRIAVELGGMSMAWIGIADTDAGLVRPVASFGDHAGYLQDIRLTLDADSPFGRGPTGTAIRSNLPVWTDDPENVTSVAPWSERRRQSGFIASGSLPLRRNGAVIGALSVYSADTRTFNESTRQLLLEMATDVSFALDGFAREARRTRAERALIASEAQLAFTERVSHTGGWSLDLDDHSSRRTLEHDRIFGYLAALPHWTHATFLEHVVAEDRAAVDRHFQEFVAGRAPLNHECRIRRADGKLRWIRVVAGHQPEAPNGARRVSGIVQDITERKRIEQVLHESQQRFEGVLASAMDAIVTADAGGTVILSNPAAARMFGYATQELQGSAMAMLMPERFRTAHALHVAHFGRSGTSHRSLGMPRPIRGLRKNGEEFPIEAAISVDTSTGLPLYTAILRDITERERVAAALEESRHRLLLATESASIGIWEWDVSANRMDCDARMHVLYGISEQEGAGGYADWQARLHPDDLARSEDAIAAALAGTRDFSLEFRVLWPDGELRHLEGHAVVQRAADGSATRVTGVNWDITERKRTETRVSYLNRVSAMLSGINTLIVRVRDRGQLFREACNIAVTIGGFRMAQIGIVAPAGAIIELRASAGKDDELLATVNKYLASPETAERTMMARAILAGQAVVANDSQHDPQVLLGKAYATHGVRSIAVLPLVVAGHAIGAIALYASEIDFFHEEELKLLMELAGDVAFAIGHIQQRERLEYLAYYDELTELANRTQFLAQVHSHIVLAAGGRHRFAVLLLDLERFRNINDSLGRAAGDSILQQVARWLASRVGDASPVARVGPDHFAVLVPEVLDEDVLGRQVAELMAVFLHHAFRVNDAEIRIAAKVGVALFPDHGSDPDTVLRHAEAALKKAKALGDRCLFYTQQMTEAVAGKLKLETQLREALDKGEFVLHYQPKVSLKSGAVTGAEALIRWNDPRTGLVPPGQFIPILEETGLIYEVGRWALRTASEDYLRWRAAGLPAVRIAVNVSPLQLRDQGFIAEVERAIASSPDAAAGLELEITESLIMEDVKHSIIVLQAIRAMGISIAIDDFGTGYSSLSYLAKLPVNTLKIDRSFVFDMVDRPDSAALVATIIRLAHGMQLKVVAEGVETAAQSALLHSLGCDEMQGFLFCKPVPRQVFENTFLTAPPPTTRTPAR